MKQKRPVRVNHARGVEMVMSSGSYMGLNPTSLVSVGLGRDLGMICLRSALSVFQKNKLISSLGWMEYETLKTLA